jgi:hypothetical protein
MMEQMYKGQSIKVLQEFVENTDRVASQNLETAAANVVNNFPMDPRWQVRGPILHNLKTRIFTSELANTGMKLTQPGNNRYPKVATTATVAATGGNSTSPSNSISRRKGMPFSKT